MTVPMADRRLCAIVNPAAGGGRCASRASKVLNEVRDQGFEIEEHRTEGPGHAGELAEQALERGARDFLAVGGDGTAFEVLNGRLHQSSVDRSGLHLGLLPLGTGNSFVYHHEQRDGGSRRGRALYRRTIEALARGRELRCDVLRLEHEEGELFALGTISLGFAADVAALVNRRLKRLGDVGYTLGVLAKLIRLGSISLEIETDHPPSEEASGARDLLMVAVQNVMNFGGAMKIAPDADPSDGELDLVTIDAVGRFELLRTFPKIFSGTHASHPAVSMSRHKELVFVRPRSLRVMLDGEVRELVARRITVLPEAISVWC